MKKIYSVLLCILLLAVIFTACNPPNIEQKWNESIHDTLYNIHQLAHVSPDSARLLLDALWRENEGQLTDSEKIPFYSTQGAIALINREYTTAKNWYLKGLEIAENRNDTVSIIGFLINIGAIQQERGADGSINYFRREQALLYNQLDISLINLSHRIGLHYERIGVLDSALYYYQKALNLSRENNDKFSEAISLMFLMQAFIQFNEIQRAEESTRQAISILESIDSNVNLHIALNNLALILIEQNRIEEALLYAQKADEIALSIGQAATSRSGIYYHRGTLYFNKRLYTNSLEMFHKSLELRQQDIHFPLIREKIAISRPYSRLGEYDKAFFYANEALNKAISMDWVDAQIDAYRNLAFIHAIRGDMEEFEIAMQKESLLRDSLFNEQRIAAVQELQIRFETEQKNSIIAQQEKDIRQKYIRIVLLIIICVFIVVLSALVLFFQRRKVQNLTQIVQQHELISKYEKDKFFYAEKSEEILPKLRHLFEVEKIYRQHRLTIDDLSAALATNRTYLSKVISNSSQKGFSEFVNTYRIEEVKELFKQSEYANYTMQAIAEKVGFSGTTSFYTVFKQTVGVTPAEYKKVIAQK